MTHVGQHERSHGSAMVALSTQTFWSCHCVHLQGTGPSVFLEVPCCWEFLTSWNVSAGGTAAAPETASAYYRYGAALLYSVQDSADVFGGELQTAAQQHDNQVAHL